MQNIQNIIRYFLQIGKALAAQLLVFPHLIIVTLRQIEFPALNFELDKAKSDLKHDIELLGEVLGQQMQFRVIRLLPKISVFDFEKVRRSQFFHGFSYEFAEGRLKEDLLFQ